MNVTYAKQSETTAAIILGKSLYGGLFEAVGWWHGQFYRWTEEPYGHWQHVESKTSADRDEVALWLAGLLTQNQA